VGDLPIEAEGERLRLLPERAVFWERATTLLVADPHWGKTATFRAGGIPVPGGTTAEGLSRLDAALARTGAARVVFLGDYLHARAGRSPRTLQALAAWRERWSRLDLVLVRGNHDRHAGDPPPELGVRCLDPPLGEPPFVFQHHPGTSPLGYVIAGHLHPAVRLAGAGRQRARLPCFVFGPGGAILPAFGGFTGAADVEPRPEDRVFVLAGDSVVPVPGR
jgi:DNA ligase-associated metallophosphoesterase